MKTHPTNLNGVLNVVPTDQFDPMGWNLGLHTEGHNLFPNGVRQTDLTMLRPGVLRGLYFDKAACAEQLLWVTRGMAQIVVVDLAMDSPTYTKHFTIDLHEDVMLGVYVPKRMAIGALGIGPETQILTLRTHSWENTGVLDALDPALNIDWGIPNGSEPARNKRDQAGMPFNEFAHPYRIRKT